MVELDAEEARIVGALIEKAATVPDTYPMTLKALRGACNQATSRQPVVAYDEGTIARALDRLKARNIVRFVHPSHGERTTKFRHVLDEAARLAPDELALVSVLLLRGPQTPTELRTRTERQHAFDSVDEVAHVLQRLAEREPPMVTCIGRQSGQRDDRWQQRLAPEEPVEVPAAPTSASPSSAPAATDADLLARVAALEAKVADLEQLLNDL